MVETASPSVQTPRTQLGGDGDSRWKRRWNTGGTPQITKRHVQSDAPQPPKQSRISYPPGASQRPTPDCSAADPPPTWELPPSLPHPPVAKTYLSEPTTEDALGSEPAPA